MLIVCKADAISIINLHWWTSIGSIIIKVLFQKENFLHNIQYSMMDHLLQMPKIILALGFIRYIKPISELLFLFAKNLKSNWINLKNPPMMILRIWPWSSCKSNGYLTDFDISIKVKINSFDRHTNTTNSQTELLST